MNRVPDAQWLQDRRRSVRPTSARMPTLVFFERNIQVALLACRPSAKTMARCLLGSKTADGRCGWGAENISTTTPSSSRGEPPPASELSRSVANGSDLNGGGSLRGIDPLGYLGIVTCELLRRMRARRFGRIVSKSSRTSIGRSARPSRLFDRARRGKGKVQSNSKTERVSPPLPIARASADASRHLPRRRGLGMLANESLDALA